MNTAPGNGAGGTSQALTGLGGSGSPATDGAWRMMPLGRLALLSPQIALCLARGDQLVPLVLSCKATFSDPNVSNIPNVALEGGSTPIVQATVIDHVDYQINQQNAFSGQTLKSLADFFFNLQSGISATIDIFGAPRYSVAPFYQPLRTLAAFLKRGFPYGWFLNYSQGIKMSFNADIPLPSLPVTVAFTYCMWTPAGESYVRMEDRTALEGLAKCGVNVGCC
jgi:hypothetical protein